MKSWVYFVRYGSEGPIKIGRADDPRRRICDLNVATPVQLILLGALLSEQADIEEVEIQRRLAPYRVKGEWFEAAAALEEMDRQATRLVAPDQVRVCQLENAWARSMNLHIRVQPDEVARWREAAREQNKPLSAWVRDVLNPFAKAVAAEGVTIEMTEVPE